MRLDFKIAESRALSAALRLRGLGMKNILTKESTLLLLIVAAFPTAVEIKHYEIRQNKPAKQSSHGIY